MDILTGVIYLVGYAFSLLVGGSGSRKVTATVTVPTAPGHYSSELLGLVERTIYTTAWLMGKELFIPVWLALKVSTHWRTEVKDIRPIFNRWLVGTGVSLAYGVTGAEFIQKAKAGEWWMAVGLVVVLVVGNLLLIWRGNVLARETQVRG